jgi:hypothetical protein
MLTNVICRRLFLLFNAILLVLVVQSAGANALQAAIDELLIKAEQDVAADRLMTPIHDNAYDRFRAVLLLDKGNERALLGLRAVAARYLAFADTYNKRGDFSQARNQLKNAVTVDGETVATRKMADDIRQAERQAYAVRKLPERTLQIASVDAKQAIFPLDASDLRQRNQAIIGQLLALGQRVQNTREYVQIFARDDAEGRWVYQQMRKASVNYRLRGNIQRASNPKVVLEAPLD